ncbi:hypothetical protein PAPHI01_1671 [Pancytospora philotis]|nr:hypothetical protein PAPHI01_1671 [Pancytospora philotis]
MHCVASVIGSLLAVRAANPELAAWVESLHNAVRQPTYNNAMEAAFLDGKADLPELKDILDAELGPEGSSRPLHPVDMRFTRHLEQFDLGKMIQGRLYELPFSLRELKKDAVEDAIEQVLDVMALDIQCVELEKNVRPVAQRFYREIQERWNAQVDEYRKRVAFVCARACLSLALSTDICGCATMEAYGIAYEHKCFDQSRFWVDGAFCERLLCAEDAFYEFVGAVEVHIVFSIAKFSALIKRQEAAAPNAAVFTGLREQWGGTATLANKLLFSISSTIKRAYHQRDSLHGLWPSMDENWERQIEKWVDEHGLLRKHAGSEEKVRRFVEAECGMEEVPRKKMKIFEQL